MDARKLSLRLNAPPPCVLFACSFFELFGNKGRASVATAFHELLVLSTQGRVSLAQEEPFGDIRVTQMVCSIPSVIPGVGTL